MPLRILIPTDFNVESLLTLKKAMDTLPDTEVEAVLMYAERLSTSITDLLFYSPAERRRQMVTAQFEEALTILMNRFEKRLLRISIEFFHGYGTAAFLNFAAAQEIDRIFLSGSYTLKLGTNGFDPTSILKKSQIPCREINWERPYASGDAAHLSLLFH
jgi:hypothetical protein